MTKKNMSKLERFTFVSTTADSVARCRSNKERLQFHYFNPGGLFARKQLNNAVIRAAVDDNLLPTGWIYAHGSLDNYATDVLHDLSKKRRVGRVDTNVCLSMLNEQIANTTHHLTLELAKTGHSYDEYVAIARQRHLERYGKAL